MSKSISHKGIIREVGPKETIVEIVSTSACAACHAKGLCSASEMKKKEIAVPTDLHASYSCGEEVEVMLSQSMGMKAVLIAYALPLVILMLLVVSLSYANMHELVVGLVSVGVLALYYLAVYLFRGRLSKEYVFTIRRY